MFFLTAGIISLIVLQCIESQPFRVPFLGRGLNELHVEREQLLVSIFAQNVMLNVLDPGKRLDRETDARVYRRRATWILPEAISLNKSGAVHLQLFAVDSGWLTDTAYMDLKAEFDSVDHNILLAKLEKLDVSLSSVL